MGSIDEGTAMMRLIDEGLEILDESECLRLLGTVRVGRVAINRGAIPVVLPVTFALVGGDIMFFTGTGTKLNAALEGGPVAFEVDDIDVDAESGWSVLVVGRAVPADGWSRAQAEALGLYAWAAGERHHLVRIRREFVSGRRVLR
jgi:nitroimidazol reductase NimA-like FMN-containing flavoprotein (pyridoxamine 5'-phosphate oxidase superfamily)